MNAVKITKLPEFEVNEPEMWFDQMDALFEVNGISSAKVKFQHIYAYGNQALLPYVHSVNKDNTPLQDGESKYDRLRKKVIQVFAESEEVRLKKLFSGDTAFIGKPSQLLMHIRNKAGMNFSDKALRSLFLDKMPERIRGILVTLDNQNIDKLAETADKIIEITPEAAIAVNRVSMANDNASSIDSNDTIRSLQDQISKLTTAMEKLLSQRASFNPRGRARGRSKSRSDSRSRRSENGLCYYHNKFGDESFKCSQPCSWVSQNNPEAKN